MCSYNKINGVHSSCNEWLLKSVLRETWGFTGAVMSDWGAAHDRDLDLKAGLDLEMPGNDAYYHQQVLDALDSGSLKMEDLDRSALRILDMINKSIPALNTRFSADIQAHRAFARKVAQESIVLLKNTEDLLPLELNQPILVLGELAQLPRIQGSGSAHVHPIQTESLLDGLREHQVKFDYRKGTNILNSTDVSGIDKDTKDISPDQIVVICVGLNEDDELEGLDRVDMNLPQSNTALIHAVLSKTNKVIVIVFGGAPIEMPWADRVPAILNAYLAGEAGGLALADILYGIVNPSGKLAETYPVSLDDIPSSEWFGVEAKQVNYRESLFVGYRYFDSADKPVRFPFGHGLSYTSFEYKDLSYAQNVVSFTLTNTGFRTGSEIVQLYISNQSGANYFPIHELKAFEKITLKEGESKVIHIALEESAFQYYDSSLEQFICADGIYEIQVGASSRDIRLTQKIVLDSQDPQHIDESWKKLWVGTLNGHPSDADFEALIGHPIQLDKASQKGQFTIDSTLNDLRSTLIGKIMRLVSKKMLMEVTQTSLSDTKSMQFKVLFIMVMAMPLRNTMLMSHGKFSQSLAYGIVDLANGHWREGFRKITGKEAV
jgi:beta-glucosidase